MNILSENGASKAPENTKITLHNSAPLPINKAKFGMLTSVLLTEVFKLLKAEDLANSVSVNKHWKKLASDENLWMILYSKRYVCSIPELTYQQQFCFNENEALKFWQSIKFSSSRIPTMPSANSYWDLRANKSTACNVNRYSSSIYQHVPFYLDDKYQVLDMNHEKITNRGKERYFLQGYFIFSKTFYTGNDGTYYPGITSNEYNFNINSLVKNKNQLTRNWSTRQIELKESKESESLNERILCLISGINEKFKRVVQMTSNYNFEILKKSILSLKSIERPNGKLFLIDGNGKIITNKTQSRTDFQNQYTICISSLFIKELKVHQIFWSLVNSNSLNKDKIEIERGMSPFENESTFATFQFKSGTQIWNQTVIRIIMDQTVNLFNSKTTEIGYEESIAVCLSHCQQC